MEHPKKIRAGFVALMGRPNVGKSTLMNAMVEKKISITSRIPQTTRHLIRGILTLSDAQIVFVDSPGVHSFKGILAQRLNVLAKKGSKDVDLILYVADVSRRPAEEEERIMKQVFSSGTNVIIVFNKIDKGSLFINEYIALWQSKENGQRKSKLLYYIPVSAKTGRNIKDLVKLVKDNLPLGYPFYEEGTVTDFPLKFRVADIIREKLFSKLKEELPHALAVEISLIEDKDKITYIEANVYVNRVSQKRIVIGKDATFIRDAGIASRRELEGIFGRRIYLDMRVKVVSDWQKKMRILKELGYDDASL